MSGVTKRCIKCGRPRKDTAVHVVGTNAVAPLTGTMTFDGVSKNVTGIDAGVNKVVQVPVAQPI